MLGPDPALVSEVFDVVLSRTEMIEAVERVLVVRLELAQREVDQRRQLLTKFRSAGGRDEPF
jgi:hypothetical protein